MPGPEKPKMQKDDKLMNPRQVSELMALSVREVYNLIAEGYFICYYPNGPGKRPVRVYKSSVIAHIESFSIKT
jgi:predicted DNA-binding transcriptional regulator AlpA